MKISLLHQHKTLLVFPAFYIRLNSRQAYHSILYQRQNYGSKMPISSKISLRKNEGYGVVDGKVMVPVAAKLWVKSQGLFFIVINIAVRNEAALSPVFSHWR